MDFIKIGLFAILFAVLFCFVKRENGSVGIVLSIAGTICIGLIFLSKISSYYPQINALSQYYVFQNGYISLLFKLIGITYICEFASGVCKESGLFSMADQITILGKISICGFAIPLILEVFSIMEGI